MNTVDQTISSLDFIAKVWSNIGYLVWLVAGLEIGTIYILLADHFPALRIKNPDKIRRIFGERFGRAIFDKKSTDRRIAVVMAVVVFIAIAILSPVSFKIADVYAGKARELEKQQADQYESKVDILAKIVSGLTIAQPNVIPVPQTQSLPPESTQPTTYPSSDPKKWTLWDLFDTDFYYESSIAVELTMQNKETGTTIKIPMIALFNLQAGAKYYAFFIPASKSALDWCEVIANQIDDIQKFAVSGPDPTWKWVGDSAVTKFSDLRFTGKIYIYNENMMSLADLGKLDELFREKGLALSFRGLDFLEIRRETGGTLASRRAFGEPTTQK